MKLKDLLTKLEKYNPEIFVVVKDNDGLDYMPLKEVHTKFLLDNPRFPTTGERLFETRDERAKLHLYLG